MQAGRAANVRRSSLGQMTEEVFDDDTERSMAGVYEASMREALKNLLPSMGLSVCTVAK
jgi:hypothetical protein